ncbi:MAG: F0F1 ATP synthase subunit A [Clostridia bacterium]|nr:F0F1 ATP synthase subunit A [Clostridia bacterium]
MGEKIAQLAAVMEHLKPVVVFHLGPIPVTTTVVTTWVMMAVLVAIALVTTRGMRLLPRGWQHLPEMTVEFIYGFLEGFMGRRGRRYLPLVATLFIFILFLNLAWLIPGAKPPTMDLSTTLAFAVTTIIAVQILSVREVGLRRYIQTYTSHGLMLTPLNIIEELVKVISLSLRLFGNMFGEETVVTILFILVPLVVPAAIQLLGVLFGFIQAFIFTLLTISYLATRTSAHH